jgi:hypothetical protein
MAGVAASVRGGRAMALDARLHLGAVHAGEVLLHERGARRAETGPSFDHDVLEPAVTPGRK